MRGSSQSATRRLGQIVQRPLVDIAPDRRTHAVFVPDRAVGEADLAPRDPFAARQPRVAHLRGDAIGGGQGQAGVHRQRAPLLSGVEHGGGDGLFNLRHARTVAGDAKTGKPGPAETHFLVANT